MRKKSKKKYEKPRMTDIKPDAKGGLLAFCKRDGRLAPVGMTVIYEHIAVFQNP